MRNSRSGGLDGQPTAQAISFAYDRPQSWTALKFYYRCNVLDTIGAGIRDFAFTLVILATVEGATLGLVAKQAVLAAVYTCGIAVVRGLRTDRHWRVLAFGTNVTMTLLSVVAAILAAYDVLQYSMLLTHAVIAGACSALNSGPSVRLRRHLGGGEQTKLAWALDLNGYVGRLISGTICLGVILMNFAHSRDELRIAATTFLIIDVLFSVPIGCFYWRLLRESLNGQAAATARPRHEPRFSLWIAFVAMIRIDRLRVVFFTEVIKGCVLSVPLAWQILRSAHRADDRHMAMLAVGVAFAGLVGNLVGKALFSGLSWPRWTVIRVLVILMPLTLLAASYTSNVWCFVGWMMLFTALASPVDSLTDATLVKVPEDLAARIAEIRGIFNTTAASFGRMAVSGIVLVWYSLPPKDALGVLAAVGAALYLTHCGVDTLRFLARRRRSRARRLRYIVTASPRPEVLAG